MHLILHDLAPERAERLLPQQCEGVVLFPAAPSVKPCTGCFQCWVKTPGQCVIPDRGREFLRLLAKAGKLTVVSRCHYGGFSPDVKALIDRRIGYMLPYFHVHEGEMHHIPRYPQRLELTWRLYGDITQGERETARRYCAANARNMHAASHTVCFHESAGAPDGAGVKREDQKPVHDNACITPQKIAFINGSPRRDASITARLLKLMEDRLPGREIARGWDAAVSGGAGAILIAFPLYVDGIPSGLLRELMAREREIPPGTRVYAMANNGFYEGEQNAAAIAMVRHWCERAGLVWGQGIGVGAGEILKREAIMAMAGVLARRSLRDFHRALDSLAGHMLTPIALGAEGGDAYSRPGLPRAMYIRGGNISFYAAAKKNGLTKREIERRM